MYFFGFNILVSFIMGDAETSIPLQRRGVDLAGEGTVMVRIG